ncbi:hypothetical protein [Paraburkholderia strydomiana]|uniref:Uncharacterized protein n=1 Tax=Paraburkholderia strydomiana TaxID=1245417 RepID=A0ABW9BYJ6_9BURK
MLTQFSVTATRGGEWPAIIDKVLNYTEHLTQSNGEEEIAFYFRQLDWLYRERLMSAPQKRRFARLIWAGVELHELPVIPHFYRGAVLTWPQPPERTSVPTTFREWLNAEPIERIERPFEHMGKIVMGFSGVRETLLVNALLSVGNNTNLAWAEHDLLLVCKKLEDWWHEEGTSLTERARASDDSTIMSYLPARLRLIAHVLHRVVAPRISRRATEENGIAAWFERLWEAGLALGTPLVPLLFAGLTWWPEKSDDVVDIVTFIATSHSDQQVVTAALSAAAVWLTTLREQTDASHRYVNWLVESVRSPTCLCLNLKLDSITELLRSGFSRHFEPFKVTLCVALNGLLSELQDDRPISSLQAAAARPLLRVSAVSLLVAMRDKLTPIPEHPAWVGAMQLAESDKLLLIRRLIL